ncbi:MAG: hypothetical protein ABIN45_02735 [Gammaproteobacteria bacterium]
MVLESPSQQLTLVVPDLLDKTVSSTQPRSPELELLLARAEQDVTTGNSEELLFKLLGPAIHRPFPTAALTYLADTDRRGKGWWLRADPVYLQTDNARVIMLGNDYLNIEQNEAAALGEILHPLFERVGMALSLPHPKRWYLHLGENPGVVFRSLHEALGHDIHAYLPDDAQGRASVAAGRTPGATAKRWRSLLNEVQMTLHESGVNRVREARGEWPINSLWFWGLGELPAAVPSRFTRVWSDEPLAIGLAKLAGAAHASLPADAEQWLNLVTTPGEHLVVFQGTNTDFIERFNTQWAAPLCAALRKRTLKSLSLYAGHGSVFHINRSLLGRWWRRRRPLTFYL